MNLKLPAGEFRAYLFDCDGTIADSMPLHYKAWEKAIAEYGGTYDEDLFYAWGGKPVRKIIADLNEMQGLDMPVEALAERKESYYHAQLSELKGIPDVLEYIEAQHGRIPFAVVSGSRRASVVGSLTALALLDKFDVLVCAEDYQHGKPAPDGFLQNRTQFVHAVAVHSGGAAPNILALVVRFLFLIWFHGSPFKRLWFLLVIF